MTVGSALGQNVSDGDEELASDGDALRLVVAEVAAALFADVAVAVRLATVVDVYAEPGITDKVLGGGEAGDLAGGSEDGDVLDPNHIIWQDAGPEVHINNFYFLPPTPTPTATPTSTPIPTPPPTFTLTPTPVASLEGYVWHDLNRNGIRDEDEPDLKGINLTLEPAPGRTFAPSSPAQPYHAVTGADGRFRFFHIPPGFYILSVADPSGQYYPLTDSQVPVQVGGSPLTIPFALYRLQNGLYFPLMMQ